MGSNTSKVKEVDEIKAVEQMNEDELSQKDKMFRSAILEIANEIKEVKASKSDKIMYRLPVQLCNWSIFKINNIMSKDNIINFLFKMKCLLKAYVEGLIYILTIDINIEKRIGFFSCFFIHF